MPKNYYIILGIPSNSTQTDIKEAYRRLAKEFHPDYYGENHAPFNVLQEAYSVLSNPNSRKSYDDSLQDTARKQQSQHVAPVRRYSEDIIEPLVPDRDPGSSNITSPKKSFHHFRAGSDSRYDQFPGNFKKHQQPENRQFEELTVQITLSPKQAQSGGNVRLKVPIQIRCPSCSRYGNARYHNCWRCYGAGFLSGEKPVLISYPAGIRDNQTMRLSLRPYNAETIYLTAIFKIR